MCDERCALSRIQAGKHKEKAEASLTDAPSIFRSFAIALLPPPPCPLPLIRQPSHGRSGSYFSSPYSVSFGACGCAWVTAGGMALGQREREREVGECGWGGAGLGGSGQMSSSFFFLLNRIGSGVDWLPGPANSNREKQ